MRRLYKSNTDKKLCGVCGGIAEYFNIDSTVVRLIFVILGFTASSGVWIYLLAALIMPNGD